MDHNLLFKIIIGTIIFCIVLLYHFHKVVNGHPMEQNTIFQDSPRPEDASIVEIVSRRLNLGKGVSTEMAIIKAMIARDSGYAWSWYCNLVMAFVDSGCDKMIAMQGAARFLQVLAEVDVARDERYIEEMERLKKQKSAQEIKIPDGVYDAIFKIDKYFINYNNSWIEIKPENKLETHQIGDTYIVSVRDAYIEIAYYHKKV